MFRRDAQYHIHACTRHPRRRPTGLRRTQPSAAGNFLPPVSFFLAMPVHCDYVPLAQFRTCLWPCVGRWASGQEAGQPPEVSKIGLASHRDRQPEAKPAHPALNGGRGLKQRRSGLFWSRRPSKGRHRRGLSILPGVRNGISRSNPRQHSGEEPRACARVSIARPASGASPADAGRLRKARAAELQRWAGGACAGPLNLGEGARQ